MKQMILATCLVFSAPSTFAAEIYSKKAKQVVMEGEIIASSDTAETSTLLIRHDDRLYKCIIKLNNKSGNFVYVSQCWNDENDS